MSSMMTQVQETFYVAPGDGKSYRAVPGEVIRRIAGLSETSGGYALYESVVAPQSGPPLHTHHEDAEAFFILEGIFQVQVGDRLLTMEPGAFVHIPKRTPHAFLNVGTLPGKMLVIFNPRDMDSFFADVEQVFATGIPDKETLMMAVGKHGAEVVGPPLSANPAI